MIDACPACSGRQLRDFHEQRGIPVNSCLLLDDAAEAADFPTGDLVLAVCESCGFYFNRAYEPGTSEYSSRYEETQGFSPRFQVFMRELAQRWADQYGLAGKHLLEIGCGKGEFLATLCEVAGATGTGVDPSWRADRSELSFPEGVEFIADFYDERYASLSGDAVICRHTLEHIPGVGAFLELVRRSIGQQHPVMLWELPDGERVLRDVAFEDIYYEHCSYFTRGSLARLFRRTGFDPVGLSLEYGDQYIVIEAFPGEGSSPALPGEDDLARTLELVDHFASAYPSKVERWRSELHAHSSSGSRTVVWGAGSKGVSYLTTLGLSDEVEFAVDVNPYKHGKYMAGTGQKVVSPDFLVDYEPDLVVVMNEIYLQEIEQTLRDRDLHPTLVAI